MYTMSTSRILDYSIFIYYLITFTKTKRNDRQKEEGSRTYTRNLFISSWGTVLSLFAKSNAHDT